MQLKNRYIIIDDDPDYCSLMEAAGERLNAYVETYPSIASLPSFSVLHGFDLAVIDFNLQCWKGTEIADYIDHFFPDMRVVLISGKELRRDATWPATIKGFVSKENGVYEVLMELEKIVDRENLLEQMSRSSRRFESGDYSIISELYSD
jgi:DNA-binding NtrC family response regulator